LFFENSTRRVDRSGRVTSLQGVSAPHPTTSRVLVAGIVLVLVGLAGWALYAVEARSERRSYSHGGPPAAYVQLRAGHTYWVAIPGGVDAEITAGLEPKQLSCSAALPGQGPIKLNLVAEDADSKATNQIGSFTAVITGSVRVTCAHLGTVFVDDAQDAGFDWSGLWLIVGCTGLAIGLPLTLSGLRRPLAAGPGPTPRPEAGQLQPERV
jgi:hypothetical protein